MAVSAANTADNSAQKNQFDTVAMSEQRPTFDTARMLPDRSHIVAPLCECAEDK